MAKQWIVFIQNPHTDEWNAILVDVEAENNVMACKEAAIHRAQEGRYMAFPNEYASYFEIKIKKVTEVEVGQGESMV
jgi:hypothetical protein